MKKTNSLKILATILVAGSVFVGCGNDSSSTPETNTTVPETNTTVPETNTTVPEDNNTSVVATVGGLLTKDGIISLPTNLVVNPENSTELIQVADVNKTYTISDLKYYSVEGNNTLQAMENNQTVILASELNVTTVSSSSSSVETNVTTSSVSSIDGNGGFEIDTNSSSSVAALDANDSTILPFTSSVSSTASSVDGNGGFEFSSSSISSSSSIDGEAASAGNILPF